VPIRQKTNQEDKKLRNIYGSVSIETMATFTEHIARDVAAKYGKEAVKIGETGCYTSSSGRRIDLSAAIELAVRETRSYPPQQPLQSESPGKYNTVIEVANETTLSAAKRQLALGYRSLF
jgi:Microbial-type PARG, catalytic domain